MKTPIVLLLALLMSGFHASVLAEQVDEPEFAAVPEPPELPDPVESGEAIEPEVTIIERDDGLIEEYRIGGRLYKVKVTPKAGPVYYLIDRNGDGRLSRSDTGDADFTIPQWVLFEW